MGRPPQLRFGLGLLLTAMPLLAHHSFAAEFDGSRKVILQGIVTKVEWTNPHAYFYADVRDERGKVSSWAFLSAGPNTLMRLGWNRTTLRVGDRVTVEGFRARGDAKVVSAREITFADGHKVFAGCPHDGSPQ